MINFQDDCRTASVIPQTIAYPLSKVDESSYISVPAFQDTLDQSGTYSPGICGEKRLSLATSAPSFLSVVVDSIGDDFVIIYDHNLSDETDAGVHTVDYTVSFLQYDDLIASTPGSFEIEIEEACSKATLIENEVINELFRIKVQEQHIHSYRFKAYTDSISELVGTSS